MDIQKQLDEMRRGSKEDFQFVMIALDSVVKEIGTVKAKMARQEERFEMMLDVLQTQVQRTVDPDLVRDLVHRVTELEKRLPPAA